MINIGLALAGLAVALARGIVGWIKPALSDGQISDFEWRKLLETVIVITIVNLAVYLPMNAASIVSDPEAISLVVSLLINELWNAWRSKKDKL